MQWVKNTFVTFIIKSPFILSMNLKILINFKNKFYLSSDLNCIKITYYFGINRQVNNIKSSINISPPKNFYNIHDVHKMGLSQFFISDIHFHLQKFNLSLLQNIHLPCLCLTFEHIGYNSSLCQLILNNCGNFGSVSADEFFSS